MEVDEDLAGSPAGPSASDKNKARMRDWYQTTGKDLRRKKREEASFQNEKRSKLDGEEDRRAAACCCYADGPRAATCSTFCDQMK